MNHIDTHNDGTLVNASPLFASVWLALYYVLRKSLNERRRAATSDSKDLQLPGDK